ncbi:MAG: hypothetical protein HUJ71_05380, partial [Pseudobutyrivibrio sp.]|nr:hypothetical protein [Pseudobutyrivibrio sp.]
MSSLIDRVLDSLEERRKKILDGSINCIPAPFTRFKNSFPGIERDKYYLVTGAPKSSKTQVTNFLFVYTPILYAYEHREQMHIKIFYFPLEETPENITLRFMAYLLYTMSGHKIRISPRDLKSTQADKVLDKSVLDLLHSKEYRDILQLYEDNVLFMDNRNPTGIYKTMLKYAEDNGKIHKKTISITNKETGNVQEVEAFDWYEPNDPKEYVISIVDHVSLISTEKEKSLRES